MSDSVAHFLISSLEVFCIAFPLVCIAKLVQAKDISAFIVWVLTGVSCGRLFGISPSLMGLTAVGFISFLSVRLTKQRGTTL